ncbi:hypothetical protein TBLA_0D03530 [Henningerozyma blattae CBS 6284]|uniref:Uncharacterized protein n=1 Tax=Henningerozyma blattae (strain ATCC 34711 / CBS 6284 / DSM 70876 / NBRC 10599 / NRRL Y-10934 / UCD 77-7) TaxID=1071380 RepID=I2H3A1_HENB6|nr:hypothetical protein TBLA_0D03530 [Tetrapisispora blattae CBS 6284]CCH60853.1 hypothetical protein TBLA_0D03530 [Tetrapisispora blattae CBS 6284]
MTGTTTTTIRTKQTTKQRPAKTKPIETKQSNTKNEISSKSKPKSKSKSQNISTHAKVTKLASGEDTNKNKLTPQEAARKAAEKRLAESNEKQTKGELGKKLAKERAKSNKTHMMEQAEQQKQAGQDTLIYD